MNRFEDELRWALKRREAPDGFADRVLSRLPEKAGPKSSWLSRLRGSIAPQRWAPAMAAALIVVLAVGTWEYRRIEQRREGERARQELIFALQLTSNKLQATKSKLLHNVGGRL